MIIDERHYDKDIRKFALLSIEMYNLMVAFQLMVKSKRYFIG